MVAPPRRRSTRPVARCWRLYEAGADDPSDVADAVAGRYRDTGLDFTAEYPIRMAVVLRHGIPSHVVALISHFAADGAGAQAMLRDVAERSMEPVDGRQPLEQARWQQSPAGRRQNEAAQRYFESILRTMPAARFRAPPAPEQPRYWRATYDSAALPLALRALTARTGGDPSVTLLAVFAMAVHATCGVDPVVVRPLVSNRFRPGFAGVVCTAVQAGLCQVPVAGAGFDEVATRARRAAMSAYKLAYFDQRDLFALVDRIGAERGERLEIGCFLNDRRDPAAGAGGQLASAAEITAALPRSAFDWAVRRTAPAFEPMILDVEDTATGLRCTAHTDTACISPRRHLGAAAPPGAHRGHCGHGVRCSDRVRFIRVTSSSGGTARVSVTASPAATKLPTDRRTCTPSGR